MIRTVLSGGLLGLLVLLSACSDPEPPAAESEQEIASVASQESAEEAAYYNELRERWLELEHAHMASSATAPPEDPVLDAGGHTPAESSQEPATDADDSTPALAIVIDDIGHNLRQGQRLIALPQPITLAILPHTPAAQRLAREAAAAGKTVILHQPMENGAGLPIGPGGLNESMSPAELQQTLRNNLDSLDHIRGINNHMGSRLTADRQAMDQIMQVLRERGLYFIDSRTTAQTQAAFAADAAGVANLSRNVFLDNERTPDAIASVFEHALELARKQGSALLIGHPYPQTVDFLEQRLATDLLTQEGVQLVSVEELLARKYRR